ncbi:MAG: hypothetical protein LC751_13385 [Actinobacteria bacterium]|nr:hypothetical protein [Actinomycetota bacterium]
MFTAPAHKKDCPDHAPAVGLMAKLARTRSWPVRANALLLVLQAAGLGGINAYYISQIDWQQVEQQIETDGSLSPEITEAVEHAAVIAFTLGPPAVLAVLAALGFVFLFRVGWLLAMIVQAITLLSCLLLYSDWEPVLGWDPVFIYPVMLYCIVMVLYLNSSEVRAAFHVRRRKEARRAVRGV